MLMTMMRRVPIDESAADLRLCCASPIHGHCVCRCRHTWTSGPDVWPEREGRHTDECRVFSAAPLNVVRQDHTHLLELILEFGQHTGGLLRLSVHRGFFKSFRSMLCSRDCQG